MRPNIKSEYLQSARPSSATENLVLVINSGSSSLKFALFDAGEAPIRLWSGSIERIGMELGRFHARGEDSTDATDSSLRVPDHETALTHLLDEIEKGSLASQLIAVGHRVVHGGPDCHGPEVVTPELEEQLRQLIPLAPLHQPHNLAAIQAVRKARPDLVQVACFDTAFHQSLPVTAQLTGLPRRFFDDGIRRYGFHGLSYEYITTALRQSDVDVDHERIIVAHLGNGASMCALRGGKSVETTMGFSALAGLPMGTRCGDLDAGIVLYLLSEYGMTAGQVQNLLYEESGLLGLSGLSRNMEDLLASENEPKAAEAIAFFCYRARAHLMSLTAALGGVDRIIFTGGIGANAFEIRQRICEGLSYIGVQIDSHRNAIGQRVISPVHANVVVEAWETNEEIVIARHVHEVLADQSLRKEIGA